MVQDQRAPKVVVNEDYLDLKDDPQKFLAGSKRGHNSTMIHTIHQLICKQMRRRHEGSVLKSRSDISFCDSPRKGRDNDSNVCRNASVVHLYQTEAKSVKPSKGSKTSKKGDNYRQDQRAKWKYYNGKKQKSDKLNTQNNFEAYHAANYVDPKLSESYCPNKTIEWKRSWTLSVFSPKCQSKQKQTPADNFDRTTYLYDDGTDIDSSILQTDRTRSWMKDLVHLWSAHFVLWLWKSNSWYCCLSLVAYVTFYCSPLHMILHIVTTIFERFGKVLVLPAQQVYQPRDNLWTLNRL
nr:unnamed protein product [Callosobruchus analis]